MRRISECFLWLMLTVYLFSFGSEGYLNITAAKYVLFVILCGLYCAAMALCAIIQRRSVSPIQLLRRSSWGQRFVLLYVLLSWVSALLSPYRSDAILGLSRYEGAVTITLYGVIFLLLSVYGRPSRALLYGCGGSALVFCLLCLVQLTGRNPLGLYPEGLTWFDAGKAYSGAYLGTIGNIDLVAAWLCLVIPLLWASLLRLTGHGRWLLLLPLAAALAVLLQMGVLAGLVGVGCSAVLSLPVILPLSKRPRTQLALILAGSVLLITVVLFCFDMGSGFLHELHELLHGRIDPAFGSGRLHIWREVWQRIPAHPWLGAGPDTMLHAEMTPFTRYDAELGRTLVSTIDTAHNEYLNILYHQGILGLAAYLSALGCLVWQWLRHSDDTATAILGAAALGYGIQACFGFSMCMTAPYFWIVLGLLDSRRHP